MRPPPKHDLTAVDLRWADRSSATHSSRSLEARERARTLRKNMSPPERLLWSRLRGNALGVRFRKQHPIGPFAVDFYCHEVRLAVEVDGACHDGQAAEDAARDAFIRGHGVEVVRYPARDVLRDVSRVVEWIRDAVAMRRKALGPPGRDS